MALSIAHQEENEATGSTRDLTMSCSGTDKLLLVFVTMQSTNLSVSTLTWDQGGVGEGLTFVAAHEGSGTFGGRVELWRKIGPTNGTSKTLRAVMSAADDVALMAYCFNGAHQTTPLSSTVSADGQSTTPQVNNLVSASDEIAVDGFVGVDIGGGDPVINSADSGQTIRAELENINSYACHGSSTETGAADVDMGWTVSQTVNWAQMMVAVKPVGAAPSAWPHGPLGHPLHGALGGPI